MIDVAQYFPTPLQRFMFHDKYSRWRPQDGRRETWPEAVDRVIAFLHKNCKVDYTGQMWDELRLATLNLQVMPSMRVLQMAGPALERDNTGVFNCAYTAIDSFDAFAELLYILMQGTGIGYSVEDEYVSRLPRIKKLKRTAPLKCTIPDNTEGWCDALKLALHSLSNGQDVEFNYSQIRSAGAVLKTKGGRASGPQPLKELLDFVRATLIGAQGRKLTTLECHDIACYCGFIVQVGGVRRAALISLSDFEDDAIATCKNGEFWKRHPYRSMSNNSAVYEEKPSVIEFLAEWLNLAKSGTGERGIFNRNCDIPARRVRKVFGLNPCGEIVLRSNQFCNLSIAVARKSDGLQQLQDKVRLATMYGTAQATLTHFPYLNLKWKKNCEEEMLLGVDITGQRDCIILQNDTKNVLEACQKTAVTTNEEISKANGLNQSAAVTCVKPSGNSSQFLDCASGLHPRYAPYYIRRVRVGAYTPVGKLLKDSGVPYFPETGQSTDNATVLVFEFPVNSPDGAICRKDVSAEDQFNYWLANKMYFTEHSASCTIYVDEHEWLTLGAQVMKNWDSISGLSFLPVDNHLYPLAPYEEITKEEYEKRVAAFPAIDYARLADYEKQDETSVALDYACTAGSCEL